MAYPDGMDGNSLVLDVMTRWPETAAVFLHHGMLCVGCLVAPFHTLSDACLEHDIDEDQFSEDLRRCVQGRRLRRAAE